MTQGPQVLRRRWGAAIGLLLLAALRVTLDLRALAVDAPRYRDWEEAHNAAVGWYAWQAGLWDQLLTLQHKEFCGGCTGVSVMAAPALALGGDQLLSFKLLAIAVGVGVMWAGFSVLDRWVGRPGAWVGAALLAAPPIGLALPQRMLWGNHSEATLCVLLMLVVAAPGLVQRADGEAAQLRNDPDSARSGGPRAGRNKLKNKKNTDGPHADEQCASWSVGMRPRRALALGLLMGLSVWGSRTALFGAAPVLALLAWRRVPNLRWLLVGALPGLGLLLAPAARGDRGRYDSWLGDPSAWLHPLERLQQLLRPGPLSERLWLSPAAEPGALVLALAVLGASLLLWRRRPTLVMVSGAFLCGFVVVNVPITEVWEGPAPMQLRYFTPWFVCLILLAAAGLGAGIQRKGAVRVGAVALAVLLFGLQLRSHELLVGEPMAQALAAPIVDHERFALSAAMRLAPERVARARSDDPVAEATLRHVEGLQLGLGLSAGTLDGPGALRRAADRRPVLVGLRIGRVQPDVQLQQLADWLGALPETARDPVGLGAGLELGRLAVTDQTLTEATRSRARGGGAPHEALHLSAALGVVASWDCGLRRSPPADHAGACLRRAAREAPDAEALMWSAGLVFRAHRHPAQALDLLLGRTRSDHAEAFRRGAASALLWPVMPTTLASYEGSAPPPWADWTPAP